MPDSAASPNTDLGRRLAADIAAFDWIAACTIIEAEWATLISTDLDVLKFALRALPPSIVAERPRLGLAANYLNYLPVAGQTRTEIFRAVAPTGEPSSMLDVLAELTSRAAARRSSGDFERAAVETEIARVAFSAATDPQIDEMSNALPELHYQWGLAFDFAGSPQGAIREYTESYDRAVMVGNLPIQAQASGSVAWIHALSGRTAESRRWLSRVPNSTGASWESRSTVPAILATALLNVHALDIEAAHRELAALGPVSEKPEYWANRLYVLALAARGPDESLDVLSSIDVAVEARPTAIGATGSNSQLLALARAKLFLKRGNSSRAIAALELFRGTGSGDNTTYAAVSARVLAARAALLAGDYASAARSLGQYAETAPPHPRLYAESLYLSAVIHLSSGATALAERDARAAITVANRDSVYSSLATLSREHLDDVLALTDATPVALELTREASTENAAEKVAPLTAQEVAVLTALADTGSVKAAAERLFISLNTAKSHLRRIYLKLGVNTKTEAIAAASTAGIITGRS